MNEACQATLSFTISQSLLKFLSIELVMLSNHLILCHPLLLLPSIFLSQHQSLFQWVLSSHQEAKVLELLLSISPSNEYSGLTFFRIDRFDLPVMELMIWATVSSRPCFCWLCRASPSSTAKNIINLILVERISYFPLKGKDCLFIWWRVLSWRKGYLPTVSNRI